MKKNIIELTTLSFTYHDQMTFAEFSGDKNPIHIDQQLATKTHAGQCIVHGFNLILTALEFYLIHSKFLPTFCYAQFKHPVLVKKNIRLVSDQEKKELRWESDTSTIHCVIKIDNQKKTWEQINDTPPWKMKFLAESKDTNLDNLELGSVIQSIYGGSSKVGKILYPKLCNFIGLARVYEIGILSNFIGMQVPGLHSLLGECSLKIEKFNKSLKPYFELTNFDRRYKLLNIKYSGTFIDAEISAFQRPFYVPKTIKQIIKTIPKDLNLSGLRMLVVGGSGGIGDSVCRVASYLGCDVSFTYKSSKEDSFLIVDDIKKHCNSNIQAFELDVTSLKSIQSLNYDYDILCYFPSEKIFGKSGSYFDIQRFEKFYKIYCVAFSQIAQRFIESGGKVIYYPSSKAVESNIKGLEEYVFSKKIGEEICKSLASEFNVEVICDRLERIETKQTLSVIPIPARDPTDVAIDICKIFSH